MISLEVFSDQGFQNPYTDGTLQVVIFPGTSVEADTDGAAD
jgi:hypothetical protein